MKITREQLVNGVLLSVLGVVGGVVVVEGVEKGSDVWNSLTQRGGSAITQPCPDGYHLVESAGDSSQRWTCLSPSGDIEFFGH